MAEERLEQRELARAEVDRPVVDRDRPGGLVERDRARDEARLGPAGGALGAPGEGPQARGKLVVGERLDEVVVGPGVEPDDAVVDGVAGGQHQDREVASLAPDPAGDFEPGDVRQADVEDDDVDPVLAEGDVEAGLAVGGDLDVVAVLLEQAGERSTEALVVLDEEDLHAVLGSSSGRATCRSWG